MLELYAVGEETFREDVQNASLVLTGLIIDKENNVRQSKFHFKGETTILEKNILI